LVKNKSLLLKGFDLKAEDDFLDSQKYCLSIKTCTIGLRTTEIIAGLIKNADADEMIFIHKGKYAP
jgi:homogentisate 1,2-dioxygenase